MVDPIQATSNALSTSINNSSSTPKANETAFADKLSESIKSNDLLEDKANKQGGCCGGSKEKSDAVGIKTIG